MKTILSILVSCILFCTCHPNNKEILLLKRESPEIEIIDYIGNRYHGNFINVIKGNENSKVHYNIGIDDNGRVLHVLKYDNKYYEQQEESLDAYRSAQLLVSDTSVKNDPRFFGNDVNGYYSDTFIINNVINMPNPETSLSLLSVVEKSLLKRIDSLAKVNRIKYLGFDTSKVLGWFKYVF